MTFLRIMLTKGIGIVIGWFIYPIIFLFRWKIKNNLSNKICRFFNLWINDDGSFVGNAWWRLATYGELDELFNHSWTYIKDNISDVKLEEEKYLKTTKDKFRYFIASYKWAAMRNGFYNYSLYKAPIGKYDNILSIKSNYGESKQMPIILFENKDGMNTFEKGDYFNKEMSFLGWKIVTWEKGGTKYKYLGYAGIFGRVYINAKCGWNWYDGQPLMQLRTGIFKKRRD